MATHGGVRHGHAQDPGHGGGHDHAEHHGMPVSTYWAVITALMVLLIITLGAAMLDLGAWNLPIAMVIAVIKVGLIVTYFMHLKLNTNLVRFFALGAFFWLLIMFVFTLQDYVTRGWFAGTVGG
jgi:cytochrome c oxidase subunit 4